MKRVIVLGITALTLVATLSPLNVKAAGANYTRQGNFKQVVIIGGNCNTNNLPGQVQNNIQSLLNSFVQNVCGNNGSTENRPENGTENLPNVEIPGTDAPNTDVPGTDNGNEQNPTDSSYAQQVVDLVNAERAKEGLSSLKFDADITDAANIRANEIQSVFSHTRPDGSNFYTVLTEQGISYRRCGENIAYGQKTPQEVVTGWMNSAGHRANIMNENYTNIGIGYQVKNGTAYWVQLFTQ